MVYSIHWYIYIGSMNVWCLFTRRLLFGLGIWDSILIVSNSATTTFWTRINYFWRLPTLCIFMISIWRRRRYGKYVFFYIYESQIKDIMHVRDRFCACKIIVDKWPDFRQPNFLSTWVHPVISLSNCSFRIVYCKFHTVSQ